MHSLRWLLVLPAALGAFLVLQVLFVVLSLLLAVPDAWNRGISQTIATIFCPYYFVYIGSKIAPDGRLYVAVSLTVVLSVIYGMLLTLGLGRLGGSVPVWWFFTCLLMSLGSCVVAVARVQNEETTPPENAPQTWQAATLLILSNMCGIIYAYAYFGQAVLFLAMFWTPIFENWLNLLNPFLYIMTMFGMLFTWYFWVLVATAFVGYYGMEYFAKKASETAKRPIAIWEEL